MESVISISSSGLLGGLEVLMCVKEHHYSLKARHVACYWSAASHWPNGRRHPN